MCFTREFTKASLKNSITFDSGAVKTALLKYILILIEKVLTFENIDVIICT